MINQMDRRVETAEKKAEEMWTECNEMRHSLEQAQAMLAVQTESVRLYSTEVERLRTELVNHGIFADRNAFT